MAPLKQSINANWVSRPRKIIVMKKITDQKFAIGRLRSAPGNTIKARSGPSRGISCMEIPEICERCPILLNIANAAKNPHKQTSTET